MKDIFEFSNVGIATGRDSVLIATNAEKLKIQVQDFYKEFDEKFIQDIAYRPFDTQKIYFDLSKVERPRFNTMRHFLDIENIALLVSRQAGAMGNDDCNPNFIIDKIVDLNMYRRGGEQVIPLYLKNAKFTKRKKNLLTLVSPFTRDGGFIFSIKFSKNSQETLQIHTKFSKKPLNSSQNLRQIQAKPAKKAKCPQSPILQLLSTSTCRQC